MRHMLFTLAFIGSVSALSAYPFGNQIDVELNDQGNAITTDTESVTASQLFNPGTTTSLRGRVSGLETSSHLGRGGTGLHILLHANNKDYSVPAGPTWYLNQIGLELEKDQDIEVEGSVVNQDGQDLIIPTTIRANGQTFHLRSPSGIPAWAEQRSNNLRQ